MTKKKSQLFRVSGPELQTFFDTSSDAIFILDVATESFIYVNQRACDLYGYSQEEVYRLGISALVSNEPPYTMEQVRKERSKLLTEGPLFLEWHARAKDGHLFWLDVKMRTAAFGKKNCVFIIAREITERKQTEIALQTAKDFAENLLRTANAMIVRLDINGNIQIFNEAAEAITGYTSAELVGRNWFEVLVPKNRFPFVKEEFQRLMTGGWPKRFENPILTKSGEERFIVWRNNEVREQGQVVGTISFGIDITEHKQAEKALQESEARNRALLTAIPDVLLLLDNRGVLLDFHSNGISQLFTPLEAHINRPIQNVLASPFGEQIVAACNRALKTGVMQQIEYQIQVDGPVEYVEARVVKSGEKTVFVMLRDITEGRKLQEQLMVSDRMASVGTLATGVAHEINNPLAAILANIELVVSKFAKLAPHMPDEEVREIRDDLGDAFEAAIRVKHIVNDLRIFSRAQEVSDGPVDIEHLLESSLRMAYNEIRHRAKVVRRLQSVPPVKGNESRLGQVLLNIIVNAAQAIEEGHAEANEIGVATRTDESGRVVIEISDTGTGMPPEIVQKLFTPFFTTKPVGVGTGLGLVICNRIVDALGGSIEVESAVGKGSTFRILLPPGRKEDFARSTLVWDKQIAPPFPGKVLIVDDECMLGRVLGRTLGGEHQVTVVTRAQEALKKISAGERFDAILCDLMMPEMSGMEFYNEVNQVASDQARQIIFMTGGAFTPRAREFLEEVPNARLQKPFEITTLKNLINMQLNETSSPECHPGM